MAFSAPEPGDGPTAAEPRTDAPAEPRTDAPAEPRTDTPAQPHVDTPAQPHVDTPAQPHVDTPAQPHVDSATVPRIDTAVPPRDHAPELRNPLLAVLGAGDAAVTAVARAFAEAFSAASGNRRTVQQRVADLPTEIEALRGRFSGEELRRALDAYRAQVERAYAEFAGRGEEAWGRLREQPQVRQAITTLEAYGEKLDGRVDVLVDDVQEAAARVREMAERRSRATGERVAQAGQRLTGRAADAVVDASAATADAVEGAGEVAVDVSVATADAVEDAGQTTAGVLEEAGRGSTDTAPTAPRRAARKPGPTPN